MSKSLDSPSVMEIHKELDLIQACITRMAQNSFMIKGWAFAIVAALAALTVGKIALWIVSLISIFILLSFWYLDAFFLTQEKLYRFKYEWVITERPSGNSEWLYDLNPYNKNMWKPVLNLQTCEAETRKEPSVLKVMFSRPCSLLIFYGSIILAGVVIVVLSIFGLM